MLEDYCLIQERSISEDEVKMKCMENLERRQVRDVYKNGRKIRKEDCGNKGEKDSFKLQEGDYEDIRI